MNIESLSIPHIPWNKKPGKTEFIKTDFIKDFFNKILTNPIPTNKFSKIKIWTNPNDIIYYFTNENSYQDMLKIIEEYNKNAFKNPGTPTISLIWWAKENDRNISFIAMTVNWKDPNYDKIISELNKS